MKKTILALSIAMVATILASCGPQKGSDPATSVPVPPPSSETSTPAPSIPVEVVLSSIAVGTYPKTNYVVGETFEVTNATIVLSYSDGSSQTIPLTIEMIVAVPDLTTSGTKQVDIIYLTKTTSYNISVSKVKTDPEVTFSIENGAIFNYDGTGTVPNISATVTAGVVYESYFEQDGTNIGTAVPTSPGTYAFVVQTEANDDYNAIHVWKTFVITNKALPSVTFSISSGTVIIYDGTGVAPDISAAVTEGVQYTAWFEKNEVNIGTTIPTEPGTYAYVVQTVENNDYLAVHKWVVFTIEAPTIKAEPVITFTIDSGAVFTYDGTGTAPDISATVADGVQFTAWFEKNEVNIGTTVPTTPGTYSYVVQTVENDTYKAVHAFRWFKIEAPTVKVDPVITFTIESGAVFTYDGTGTAPDISATVPDGIDYEAWFEENEVKLGTTVPTTPGTYSFVVQTVENATYKAIHAFRWFKIEAPTVKVDPVISFTIENGASFAYDGTGTAPDISATVPDGIVYETWFEENEVKIGTTVPTTPGTYSYVVQTVENGSYKAVHAFRWFKIEAPTSKVNPVITFSINNRDVINYDGTGTAPDISATVTAGVNFDYWFENESEQNIGKTVPSTPGAYSFVVLTEENDEYLSLRQWRTFTITNKAKPTITFSIKANASFAYDGTGAAPDISATVTEGVQFESWFSVGSTKSETCPTVPGTYSFVVKTTENDDYVSIQEWVVFKITAPTTKVNPTIKFSITNGKIYEYGEVVNITITVPAGVEYSAHFEKKGVNVGTEAPTEPGAYSYVVQTVENDEYLALKKWATFTIKEAVVESVSLKKALPR